MSSNTKTITRKIHFFQFEIFETRQGSNDLYVHSNPSEIFKNIAQLSFSGDQLKSRFKFLPNNDVYFLNYVSIERKAIKGKFALSRRNALPELETEGILKPLKIPENSGLAEITHFIYFLDKKILGVEFNFFGPRPNSLKNYLIDKSHNFDNPFEYIEIRPILNQDIEQKLQDMGEINLLEIEIARNAISIIKELNSDLHSAFDSAARVSDAESVEIILRKKKYSRRGFNFPFPKQKLKEILSTEDNRQKFNKLKASAESLSEGITKNYDLLEDKMIFSKKVAALGFRSRSVDSSSIFEKIEEAYNELKENFP